MRRDMEAQVELMMNKRIHLYSVLMSVYWFLVFWSYWGLRTAFKARQRSRAPEAHGSTSARRNPDAKHDASK
jgi:hypothetical protein